MRKFTLLFLLVAFSVAAFSQNSIAFKNKLLKQDNVVATNPNKEVQAVVWSDDFTTPANWTCTAVLGTDNWVIGTTGSSGTYQIGTIASTSGGNFALFDSDLMCSGNQTANLTTTNAINLTGHAQVMLQFEQLYRRWYDSTFVFVSTDGTTWTKFPVNAAYANNTLSSNPNIVSVNISSAIAGNPANVKIRFQFYSPSSVFSTNAGCGYSWMIDDVKIIDALTNDIETTGTYADFSGLSYYALSPLSQVTDVNLCALVTNNGSASQTAVTLNASDAVNVISGTSTPMTLASGASDTLVYTATLDNTVGKDYGFRMNVTQTETDEVPANNLGDSIFFSTNDTWYFRTLNLNQYLTSYSFGTSAPAITGMEYGANYHFLNNDVVDSIVVLIYGANGTGTLTGKLYNIDLVSGVFTQVGTTAPYTPTGTPELKTLALTTPYPVAAGSFLSATVQLNLNVTTAPRDTIKIGAESGFPGMANIAGSVYLKPTTSWLWTSITNTVPMVGLIVANATTISHSNLSKDVFVYPNPASNNLYIVNQKAVSVEIYSLTGDVIAKYNNQNIINVSGIAQGTYFVRVITDKKVITEKVNIVH